MRLIDADEIKKDFAEILEHNYADDYARGFKAALVGVLGYKTIAPPPNDPLPLEELTIEEAITHAREVAEARQLENGPCARQHGKLAEWLEELESYRGTGLSPGTVSDLLERFHSLSEIFDDLDLVDRVHFQAFLERVRRWHQAKKDGRLIVLPPNDSLVLEATDHDV